MKKFFKSLCIILAFVFVLLSAGCGNASKAMPASQNENTSAVGSASIDETVATDIDEEGEYTGKDNVALYIHTYGHLPSNFITKKEAKNLGWSSGDLWAFADGKSIGGDRFGNREGILPEEDGRQYYECDIDYEGGKRGAKRIVFSDDGLVFYTEDHYAAFEQLY